MPITDNSFTEQEVVGAITAKPELIPILQKVFEQKEYVVSPKKDYDSREATIASGITSKIATEVESNIETITGIKKINPQEKWTDYYTRVAKEVQAKAIEGDTHKKTLDELRKTANLSDAEKQRLTELESLSKEQLKKLTDMETTHKNELQSYQVKQIVQSSIAPVVAKFNKDPKIQKAIEIVSKDVINKMVSKSQIDPNSGNAIFFGEDGKALLNPTTKAYMTAEEIYTESMKDFIDEGLKTKGAGGSGQMDIKGVPSGVTNQIELSEHLQKQGLVTGSPEYNTQFNKYAHLLPRR